MPTVIIDPGHGGMDPGAVYKGRQEKDDNLRLALAVGELLSQNGVDVLYTRTDDVYDSPYRKAMIANESGADYLISFHRNASLKMFIIFINSCSTNNRHIFSSKIRL